MTDRFVRWYRSRTTVERFAGQVQAYAQRGMVLNRPSSGSALVLNVDGDQVPVSVDEIARWVGAALAPLNVKWWLDEFTDVVCYFNYEPLGWESQDYDLGGLTWEEMDVVEELILGRVAAHPEETLFVVLDRSGSSAETDWDRFVSDESVGLEVMPNALVLPKGDSRVSAIAAGRVCRDLGDHHVLISRTERPSR